jgi:hypothetical protein
MKSLKTLLASLLCLIGCINQEKSITSEALPISVEFSEEDVLLFSDFVDSLHTIRLESTTQSILGNIIRVSRVNTHSYLILERVATEVRLLLFSNEGKFIRSIGQIGRGPGEYVTITAYAYDDATETVHIYDQTQMSFYKYKLSGDFIEKLDTKLVFEDFTITETGGYILYASFGSNHPDTNVELPRGIYYADKNGKYVKTIFSIEGSDKYQFFNQLFFAGSMPGASLISSFNDYIYTFKNDEIQILYKLDYGKRALPDIDRNSTEIMDLTGEYVCAKALPNENNRFLTFWAVVSGREKTVFCLFDKTLSSGKLFSKIKNDINGTTSLIVGGLGNELYAWVNSEMEDIADSSDGSSLLQILYTKQ